MEIDDDNDNDSNRPEEPEEEEEEPVTYTYREDGCSDTYLAADTMEEAIEEAHELTRDSFSDETVEETSWVDGWVIGSDGSEERITTTIDPEEPTCPNGEHDWCQPEWLGGCAENPGVWGHGGSVMGTDVCRHCGLAKHWDSWAQRPDTGEQGLHSVRYESEYAQNEGHETWLS